MSISESRSTTPGTIAFIGGGNMARSLIGGLIARGQAADTIRVAEPARALRDALQRDFDVHVSTAPAPPPPGRTCGCWRSSRR